MVDEMFDEHVTMMEVEDAQSSSVGGGPHLNMGSGGAGAGANGGSGGNGGPMQQANALLQVIYNLHMCYSILPQSQCKSDGYTRSNVHV